MHHDRVGRWRVFILTCTLTIEYDTFPSAPRRTGLDTFASSGSPVMHHSRCGIVFPTFSNESQVNPGVLHCAYLVSLGLSIPWLPSPYGWLSQPSWQVVTPATTMKPLSP